MSKTILLTGATGFVGRALTRALVAAGHRVRILLRPSPRSPDLPRSVPVEVAVTSLRDPRGLRAALQGIQVIYHLASGEAAGGRGNLQAIDIDGTRNLVEAAKDASIERIFYLSHLDANPASAFPVLKAKGIAEEFIRSSGLPYTILRASILFGMGDTFTSGLAMLLALSPGVLLLPGDGKTLVQPLWVEDLAVCFTWALDLPETLNQTLEVGGSEAFTFRQVVETIMRVTRQPRLLLPASLPFLRALTVIFETAFPDFPTNVFWLDYLSVDRTCPFDSAPRLFGLMPARFTSRLEHLKNVHWGRQALRRLFIRPQEPL